MKSVFLEKEKKNTSVTWKNKLWHQPLGKKALPVRYFKTTNDIKSSELKVKALLVTLWRTNVQSVNSWRKEEKARSH